MRRVRTMKGTMPPQTIYKGNTRRRTYLTRPRKQEENRRASEGHTLFRMTSEILWMYHIASAAVIHFVLAALDYVEEYA